MSISISDNTKAILLLTAPLLVGKGKTDVSPLTLSEYNKLARYLADAGNEPADLLNRGREDLLPEWQSGFETKRIDSLLDRGFLLAQAINSWQERTIWVVSRADDGYPQRLKERLGASAPTVLYGCGNRELLETGGLAVVGSRNTSEELLEHTEGIGRLAARAGCAIISGGAKGIDQAAMHGALIAGGTVAGVLTNDLYRESVNREHRDALMDDQLVLVSQYDPKAGFNAGHAMQRNKLIYALADAGLVVDSAFNEGGTWTGAVEQLDKLRLVPVYTRSEGEVGAGLEGLRRKGALEWPNPQTSDEFRAVLAGKEQPSFMNPPKQETFLTNGAVYPEPDEVYLEPDRVISTAQVSQSTPPTEQSYASDISPEDALFSLFEQLIDSMGTVVTESEVIGHLDIEKRQAQVWLKRLVEEEKYKKLNKPTRYIKNFQPSMVP